MTNRTRIRTHGTETTEQQSTDNQARTENSCPECDGKVVADGQERVCQDCGLVVDNDNIDRGPEWRAFNQQEKNNRSRVGAPRTVMMHDDGLSTKVGWNDTDAYGNSLSNEQRKKMSRLRTWNERIRTKDAQERNLKQALGEIQRMGAALGIKKDIQKTASVIYRRALNEDLIPGRSIEGVATACLYAAARKHERPRSFDDVARVSRVEKKEITRTYRYINNELNLEIKPADPKKYVPRIIAELEAEVTEETKREANRLIDVMKDHGLHSGTSPVGLAAAAVYTAGILSGDTPTQAEVSDASDVTEVTIRQRFQEFCEVADDAVLFPTFEFTDYKNLDD